MAEQDGNFQAPVVQRNAPLQRSVFFLLLLAGLAVVGGYLLSKATLIGRTGIAVFYKEYRFMKYWWKGATVMFGVWLFLFLFQGFLQRKLYYRQARLLHLTAI